MKHTLYWFALATLLASVNACAAWGDSDIEFDEEKPWQEIAPQLPSFPKMTDALPFYVSATATNQFFVDAKSLSVGSDGVVHYTLIVTSPSGVMNVSYEGIRCQGKEKKIYAYGRTDGTWGPNNAAKWSPIVASQGDRQQAMLYSDFFCPGFLIVKDVKEAVDALKRGRNPRADP